MPIQSQKREKSVVIAKQPLRLWHHQSDRIKMGNTPSSYCLNQVSNCEKAFAIVTLSKRQHKNGQYPPHIALTMVIMSYTLVMIWKQPQEMADIDIKQPISSKNTENNQFPIPIACHHCLSLLRLPLPLPINIIPLLLPLPFIVTLHHHLSPLPHHHRVANPSPLWVQIFYMFLWGHEHGALGLECGAGRVSQYFSGYLVSKIIFWSND